MIRASEDLRVATANDHGTMPLTGRGTGQMDANTMPRNEKRIAFQIFTAPNFGPKLNSMWNGHKKGKVHGSIHPCFRIVCELGIATISR
jgi:hypothetical protein